MFKLFKSKESVVNLQEPQFNYTGITVDMHSHVLPGIDDGAQSVEDSISLIRKMMGLGIRKIIATPHIMADYYRNTAETIHASLAILKAGLEKEGINITVEAAAEHYLDETFETLITTRKLMTMGDNLVLFELPPMGNPTNLLSIIKLMREMGYKPILAHPERYTYLKLDDIRIIKDYGCRLQLNTISLTGYYGKGVKKAAEDLADSNLLDYISSDMHHLRHAEAFEKALSMPHVQRLLSGNSLKNSSL